MIYLDNAATTKLSPQALEAMLPFLKEQYGNPSAVYSFSDSCKKMMGNTQAILAQGLGVQKNEIYFTSGGTESDNWALKTAMEAGKKKGKTHLITSQMEHHAILHTCKWLEQNGCEVSYLPPDRDGIVRAETIERAIRPNTMLLSIMTANNEIGSIQPIQQIGKIAKKYGIWFHTDAVQAFGHIPISVKDCNIAMLSASAHKFHGPKGIGFLYMREDVRLASFMHGGAQERGRRSGTENTAGIAGMGKAGEEALLYQAQRGQKEILLREYLLERILKEIPYAFVNGSRRYRLPNNVNVTIPFIEGEALVLLLSMKGICISAGSACSAGSAGASHVLKAIGLSDDEAHASIRLTLSEETTKEELDETIAVLKDAVKLLRSQSALYQRFLRDSGRTQ